MLTFDGHGFIADADQTQARIHGDLFGPRHRRAALVVGFAMQCHGGEAHGEVGVLALLDACGTEQKVEMNRFFVCGLRGRKGFQQAHFAG